MLVSLLPTWSVCTVLVITHDDKCWYLWSWCKQAPPIRGESILLPVYNYAITVDTATPVHLQWHIAMCLCLCHYHLPAQAPLDGTQMQATARASVTFDPRDAHNSRPIESQHNHVTSTVWPLKMSGAPHTISKQPATDLTLSLHRCKVYSSYWALQ